jgi:hypothetical protein
MFRVLFWLYSQARGGPVCDNEGESRRRGIGPENSIWGQLITRHCQCIPSPSISPGPVTTTHHGLSIGIVSLNVWLRVLCIVAGLLTTPRSPRLALSLPAPRHQLQHDDDDEPSTRPTASTSSAVAVQSAIPPYGHRQGWKPKTLADFGDGGAYPECHVAQFPLEMGRANKTTAGNTLALQVDADGNVKYDAIGE